MTEPTPLITPIWSAADGKQPSDYLREAFGGKLEERKTLLSPDARLSQGGREVARQAFSELQRAGNKPEDVLAAAVELRGDLRANMKSIRRHIRSEYRGELKEQGTKLSREEFNQELGKRLAHNESVNDVVLTRRLLTSVTQRARSEIQKGARDQARQQITDQRLSELRQELTAAGKRVPSEALLRNIVVQRILKETRLAAANQVSEVGVVEPRHEDRSESPVRWTKIRLDALKQEPVEQRVPMEDEISRSQYVRELLGERMQAIRDRIRNRMITLGWQAGNVASEVKGMYDRAKRHPYVTLVAALTLSGTIAASRGAFDFSPATPIRETAPRSTLYKPETQPIIQEVTPIPTPKPEAPKPKEPEPAYGTVVGKKTEGVVSGTNQRVLLPRDQAVKILGYADATNTVRVEDPRTRQVLEVAVDQLDVDGSIVPKEQMPRQEGFGIRNDWSELMDKVPEIGASMVRISGGHGELLTTDGDARQAIEAAMVQKLDIVYDLNPGEKISRDETRRRIKDFLSVVGSYDKKIILELGNEPDNREVAYWKNRDLATFAQWVAEATDEARKLNPNVEVVVGALADTRLQKTLVRNVVAELGKLGIDPGSVVWGEHAYTMQQLVENTDRVRQAVGDGKVMLTELGSRKNSGNDKLVDMIDKAKSLGILRIIVHELTQSSEGYGLLDPYTRKVYTTFWQIQRLNLEAARMQSAPAAEI